jgi:hypothetical protein
MLFPKLDQTNAAWSALKLKHCLYCCCVVQVINKYQGVNAIWMPDVVGRAYGNRGNARSRQVG